MTLFIGPLVRMGSSEFVVTNKRIVIKDGVFSTHTLEMNIGKVETIRVDRSFIGTVLGFGDVLVVGTGGSKEKFSKVAKPMKLRQAFQQVEND